VNPSPPTTSGAAPTWSNRLWGVAGLLVGLAALGASGRIIVLAAGQDDWIPVEATVVQSHTTQRTKGSGFTPRTSSHFAYRYEVDGQTYTADRYSYWSVGGSQSTGTENFDPGDALTAFHHPDRPEIAVVERVRPSVFVWVFVVFGMAIGVRGAVMIATGRAAA
jgi:hypothetical protein